MTQSGQGEEPSARPAREGIVLPSDGGEPLLPGMPGASGGGRPGGPAPAPPPTTSPAGGQAWGTSWGPDQQENPPAGPGWTPPPAQPWGSPEAAQQQSAAWGTHPGAQPMPPEGTPTTPYGTPPGTGPQHHTNPGYAAPDGNTGYGGPTSAPATPADGAAYGRHGATPPQPAAHGGPGHGGPGHGGPSAGDGAAYGQNGAAPLPPGGQGGPVHGVPSGADGYGPGGAAPLPGAGQGGPGHALPPADGAAYGRNGGAPLPPAAGAPPHGGHTDQATHFLPPVAASAQDDGATQYIAPVGPGALPPEMPAGARAESPAEATQFLGRAPQPDAGPLPPASSPVFPPGSGADAEATQYMAPVTDRPRPAPYGERQPPAEFDNLFRSEPGAEGPAVATQQMPRFERPGPPHAAPNTPYGQGPAGAGGSRQHGAAYDDADGRGDRSGSRVPLIAAIGVALAVVGIGAGALLAGGGGDEDEDAKNQQVSATAPADEESASPSADPAEQQAVELDKLLADSGDSRTSVINAVADVKSCQNLAGAAKDLRDAAKQRSQLVTSLSGLTVDKLPEHAALTDALTKAWRASESADNHYAAWADQVAAKKSRCKKGQAFTTGQTAAGNRESGIASQQKTKAAELWNAIAKDYGLTQRRPTQL